MNIESWFQANWPLTLWRDLTIVVAVSGGADSLCLANLVCRQRMLAIKTETSKELCPYLGRVIIAHANHQLRGADSDEDQAFVEKWVQIKKRYIYFCANDYSSAAGTQDWLHFRTIRLNIQHSSEGLENDCRTARYRWLQQLADTEGARYILTAHNSDDQVETILYRILRGTGLAGLRGIQPIRRISETLSIVRPLLTFSRPEIETQMKEWNESWRTDKTNYDCDFSRNKIRNQLLPLLQNEYNTNARQSILQLGSLATEADNCLNDLVNRKISDALSEGALIIDRTAKTVVFHTDFFTTDDSFRTSNYCISEIIRKIWRKLNWGEQAMGLRQWNLLTELFIGTAYPKIQLLPERIQAVSSPRHLTLRQLDE